MRFKSQTILLTALAAVALGGATSLAQSELTKHIVFTEKAGFVAGRRTTIGPADATISPDPLGRFALILHKDAQPGPEEQAVGATPEPPSSALLLYDAHTGRAKNLWRDDSLNHRADIIEVTWLSGADAALVVVAEIADKATGLMPDGLKPTSSLLLIRPGTTGAVVRTVWQSDGFVSVAPSPAAPIAIVSAFHSITSAEGKSDYTNAYFTVTERGVVGPTIAISPQSLNLNLWSDDGLTTYFMERVPAPPGGKASRRWYSFDMKTQSLVALEAKPKDGKHTELPDTNPLRLASGDVKAAPPLANGQPPTAKTAQFTPLWAVRADGKHEGRLPTATVIAPDAQDSVLLADDSAVLYIADHTVYAVPLTQVRRPDFDAAYRKMLQMQTVANAKQLGLAMIGYSQDYDEKLPATAELTATLSPYLMNKSVFNNPETDTPAFTYLLGGQGIAGFASPATTVMGYLAGPGGRAAVYADGHVKWEGSD